MAAEGFYLVQGDKTTCGGKITTGAEDHTLFDKPVAREQDSVTCGKHAGLFKIAGGIDNDTIHDRRMAGTLDSYSTCPCKAKFIPSMMDDTYQKYTFMDSSVMFKCDDHKATEAYRRQYTLEYEKFTEKTKIIIKAAESFPENYKEQKKYHPSGLKEQDGKFKYTNRALSDYSAHAGYSCGSHVYRDEFVNIKGSLSSKDCFPGVELIPNECGSDRDITYLKGKERISAQKLKRLKSAIEPKNKEYDFYRIANVGIFMSKLDELYKTDGETHLHPMTKYLIESHLERNNYVLPTRAGIAGLHAEVQALNDLFIKADKSNHIITEDAMSKATYTETMLSSVIFTKRLTPKTERGSDFPACHNCAGILELACVITGITRNPQDRYHNSNRRNG
ncbi:YwqJ-related putative deaminase [Cedecea sp. NFIX57]|jgi:hypothetical protein|uniref:YwqJ-related putative deaminase n=1 Tax=Cedecea sp. NFIX57 TaxID=1566286 RepID=UPI000A0A6F03|nr:YwqJ-related putative deaminase [Cedecea sp. NFIX57]SMG55470.1 PAAR motif-containing protein [Cedecea sp. NFIX57]